MTSTWVYVDFGAVRIQHYLTRTPGLRGHRAASNTLAQATDATEIARVVGTLAEVNREAGEADGVVSLRFPAAGADDADADDAGRVRRLQDVVFAHLRRALPGAEFHSVWGAGESYLTAYAHTLQPKTHRGEVRHDLPPTAEFPLAVPCRMCHTDPAVGSEPLPDGLRALCLDCSMRNVTRRQTVADQRSPEGRLRNALDLKPAPDDFTSLAGLGSATSGRNHLATVAVDGNSIGVFFKALADASNQDGQWETAKSEVSTALSDATRTALENATLDLPVTLEHERLCVVPHVVGGDDVLVSLPADQAWSFTLTFLQEFGRLVREATSEVLDALNASRAGRPGLAPLQVPTASAGLVFAHASDPLNLLVESAAQRLSEAKRAFGGRQAAVQWLDITADGPEAPTHPPLALRVLRTEDGGETEATAALSRLVTVPASHRARLTEALRGSGPITAAAISHRVGHLDAVKPFLSPLDSPLDRPDQPPASGIGLGAALGLSRWWPCA